MNVNLYVVCILMCMNYEEYDYIYDVLGEIGFEKDKVKVRKMFDYSTCIRILDSPKRQLPFDNKCLWDNLSSVWTSCVD